MMKRLMTTEGLSNRTQTILKEKDKLLDILDYVNILAARNHKSGNLEIRVPVLGNRLFCA